MDGAPDRLPELNHWHQQLSRNLHEFTSHQMEKGMMKKEQGAFASYVFRKFLRSC